MHASDDDPRVGSVVQERYRILERLAQGGMGVVYRAERVQLGRIVAIKFLHAMFASQADFLKRFEREAKLMSRLEHPHCVSVIDFGVTDSAYIVMEFVTGTTLKELIDEEQAISPARAIRITRQILAGLAHAHEHGIVHRDIKPANIMLAQATGTGDHARILDFGLAKLRGPDQSTTSMLVGTPSYMSPEQTGGGDVDGRSDLYSCALVLFELLTLDRPFYSDEPFEMIRMHREQPAPRLAERCSGREFSAELERVVASALAKSPAARPQTPQAFADALAAVPEAADDGQQASLVHRAASPVRSATPSPLVTAPTVALESAELAEFVDAKPSVAPVAPVAPAAPAAPVGPAAALESAVSVESAPRFDEGRRLTRGRRWGRAVAAIATGGLLFGLWSTGWLERGANQARSAVGEITRDRAAASEPPSDPEPSLAAAEALVAAGQRESAIRMLHELRRRDPKAARISYLLGGLYRDKQWTLESLAAYSEAIDRDPKYAKRSEIAARAIDALGDPASRNKARALLFKQLGAAALPALRAAAREHAEPTVRREAAALVEELARTRTR